MPNITGWSGPYHCRDNSMTGLAIQSGGGATRPYGSGNVEGYSGAKGHIFASNIYLSFNASSGNSIYSGATIQPNSLIFNYLIKS